MTTWVKLIKDLVFFAACLYNSFVLASQFQLSVLETLHFLNLLTAFFVLNINSSQILNRAVDPFKTPFIHGDALAGCC